jgi:hypothetical protein
MVSHRSQSSAIVGAFCGLPLGELDGYPFRAIVCHRSQSSAVVGHRPQSSAIVSAFSDRSEKGSDGQRAIR